MAQPAKQLERLAVEAVGAVQSSQAEGVWMVAFERLTALGSSSKHLIQALVRRLTGMGTGPLRVSLATLHIISRFFFLSTLTSCQFPRDTVDHCMGKL